ncbi:MAG: DUF1801 domain-containing protein [Bacteroidales bacterium]|nr:DUF1801 domain-containing protein [Bacteroidales bacterium]MBN2819584.1 DUF1801 domain-containing protein [Bacteroidales bacterium]
MKTNRTQTVDEYIAVFPEDIREILTKIRLTILNAAPEAEEKISYQMPAFKFHEMLVYFAAFNKHIGFYPTPSGIIAFKDELAKYPGGKGSVQFTFDKPIPYNLIADIVKFRLAEVKDKIRLKK